MFFKALIEWLLDAVDLWNLKQVSICSDLHPSAAPMLRMAIHESVLLTDVNL